MNQFRGEVKIGKLVQAYEPRDNRPDFINKY